MITVLAGGGGGAKLVDGLAQVLPPSEITIIANTGDDIKLHGLHISPDVDSIAYTLAGLADTRRGWGLAGDTFHCLENLARLGVETWFQLGDRDLATHLWRTIRLEEGFSLSEVTAQCARSLGIRSIILPMTDSYVPTRIITSQGEMHFQEYFVQQGCAPEVQGIIYQGMSTVRPSPGVLEAIEKANGIIIAPSNPFVSIGPILAVPGIRHALQNARARVLAVSPVVAGRALKGPTARMLRELQHEVSAVGVARIYADTAGFFMLDCCDAALGIEINGLGMRGVSADTIMGTKQEKRQVALSVLKALNKIAL